MALVFFRDQAYLAFLAIRDGGLFPTQGMDHPRMHGDSLGDNLRKNNQCKGSDFKNERHDNRAGTRVTRSMKALFVRLKSHASVIIKAFRC